MDTNPKALPGQLQPSQAQTCSPQILSLTVSPAEVRCSRASTVWGRGLLAVLVLQQESGSAPDTQHSANSPVAWLCCRACECGRGSPGPCAEVPQVACHGLLVSGVASWLDAMGTCVQVGSWRSRGPCGPESEDRSDSNHPECWRGWVPC